MEQDLLIEIPDFKLYKDRSIYMATFLGGPLVAGYLAAENFKQLGQHEKVRTAWIISIITTIVVMGLVFIIPASSKVFPNYILPLFYAILTQYLIKRFQGAEIKEHIENGGQVYSNWRALLISIIGALITVSIILLILLITAMFYK
jgi:hypothetical protein